MPTACVCVCVCGADVPADSQLVRSAFSFHRFRLSPPQQHRHHFLFSLSLCPSLAQPLLRHTVSQQPKLLPLKINGRVTTDKTKYDSIRETCQKSSEFGRRSRELQFEGVICLRLPDQRRSHQPFLDRATQLQRRPFFMGLVGFFYTENKNKRQHDANPVCDFRYHTTFRLTICDNFVLGGCQGSLCVDVSIPQINSLYVRYATTSH